MAKILILGDVHGKLSYLQDVVRNAKNTYQIDYAIQVGDFGFYPHVFEPMKRMSKLVVPLYAIDGNHEKHEWIFKQKKVWKRWEETNNIIFCPRGTTIELDNRLISFIGGAMNVDRPQYGSIEKRTTNYLLFDEAKEIVEKLNSMKRVDLMVTHSCPHSIGVGMTGHPMFIHSIETFIKEKLGVGVGPIDDVGEEVLKWVWEHLDNKPLNWVFGHFHQHHFSRVEDTNFWCVGSTDDSDDIMFCVPYIYDTKTNVVEKITTYRI